MSKGWVRIRPTRFSLEMPELAVAAALSLLVSAGPFFEPGGNACLTEYKKSWETSSQITIHNLVFCHYSESLL